jgi:hypothetical protein
MRVRVCVRVCMRGVACVCVVCVCVCDFYVRVGFYDGRRCAHAARQRWRGRVHSRVEFLWCGLRGAVASRGCVLRRRLLWRLKNVHGVPRGVPLGGRAAHGA